MPSYSSRERAHSSKSESNHGNKSADGGDRLHQFAQEPEPNLQPRSAREHRRLFPTNESVGGNNNHVNDDETPVAPRRKTAAPALKRMPVQIVQTTPPMPDLLPQRDRASRRPDLEPMAEHDDSEQASAESPESFSIAGVVRLFESFKALNYLTGWFYKKAR